MTNEPEPTNAVETEAQAEQTLDDRVGWALRTLRSAEDHLVSCCAINQALSMKEIAETIKTLRNSHADLLTALKVAYEHVGSGNIADIKIIEAALAKAEPEEGGAA